MPTDLAARFGRIGRIATTPPFARHLAGTAAAALGEWIKRTVFGWVLWEMTGSAAWLGVLSFALLGPSVLGTLAGGIMADRLDRRWLIAFARGMNAAAALAVAALLAAGAATPGAVVLCAAVAGLTSGLAQPSTKTIVSDLVPMRDLPNAVALKSTLFNLATLVGPAVAAALILTAGAAVALVLGACLLLAHAVLVVGLPAGTRATPSGLGLLAQFAEGFHHARRSDLLWPTFVVHAAGSFMMRPFLDLAPAIADEILGRGPDGIALITGSVGAGAVAGGLYLAGREGIAVLPRLAFAVTAALAIGLVAIPHAGVAAVALGLAAGMGFASILRAASVQTLMQLAAPAHVRGRVLGLYGLVLHAGGALGGLSLGLLAERLGLASAFALAGAAVLATLALAGRPLRTIDTRRFADADPEPLRTPLDDDRI